MNPFVDHFLACRTPSEYLRLQILTECDAAPTDMLALFRQAGMMPQDVREWLHRTSEMMFSEGRRLQLFKRRPIGANVALFSTRRSDDEPRNLVLMFCGLADRPQMSVPVMCQHLDAASVDVLMLRDPSKRIYLDGIPGYGPDLQQVVERIQNDVDLDKYGWVRPIGTSGGGWASFAAGTMLRSDRALAMSGMAPVATFRLTRAWAQMGYKQEPDFTMFERLLASVPDRSTQLLAFYGADCQQDRDGAEALQRISGSIGIAYAGITSHNLLFEILKRRRLTAFMRRYLAGDLDEVVPPEGERVLDIEDLEAPSGLPTEITLRAAERA